MVNDVFSKMTKNEFEFLNKFGSRSNVLFGKELPMLIYFSYGFVKIDLPEYLTSGKLKEIIEAICKEQDIIQNESMNEHDVIAFFMWLKDEFEIIQRLEKEHLNSPPDIDMQAAGVRELDEFGELNVIDSLSGGDILKWEQVEKLPYYKVFDKLKKNIVESRINKKYNEIITKKK